MPQKINSTQLKLRLIKRKQVQQLLAISASFAVLMSGCGGGNSNQPVAQRSAGNSRITPSDANQLQDAVFYENVEQCRLDIKKQQDEYQVLLQAYQTGKLSDKPNPPVMEAKNCDAQIQAAKEEHARNAPLYRSRLDCEADGYRCESIVINNNTSGYRPVFAGTYFYHDSQDYVHVYRGGTRYRVYRPRTVYYSRDSSRIVIPSGTSVPRFRPGRVKVPQQNTRTTPQRPKGKAARGPIKGRGSNGFGSSFKGTGRGGK